MKACRTGTRHKRRKWAVILVTIDAETLTLLTRGGNGIATVYDIMVYYGQRLLAAQLPPPVCPKCGSHRTQVVGRSSDAQTVIVRCNSCGERSSVVIGDRDDDKNEAQADLSVETVAG
jgi:hypothetical protein